MTEYEEILSERVAEVGDKFILRGDVYEAVDVLKSEQCEGCIFYNTEICGDVTPLCDVNDVIFVKEVV